MNGLLIVNAFLKNGKFGALYDLLADAARRLEIGLSVKTNAEIVSALYRGAFRPETYDFCLFWDKDVQLAAQLERLGLRLFNSSDAIAACDDKALTYLRLKPCGLPMPETVIAPKTFSNVGYTDLTFAREIGAAMGYPLIVKECFGSFGMQVYWCRDEAALTERVRSLGGAPFLFQKPVMESLGRDVRVNVVGDRAVAAMLRHSESGDFRSNLTIGGSMEPHALTRAEEALAVRAVQALGLDFAGVDLLFGRDGPLLCEVNSNAHFATTLQCTGVNMAEEILRHIRSVCLA